MAFQLTLVSAVLILAAIALGLWILAFILRR